MELFIQRGLVKMQLLKTVFSEDQSVDFWRLLAQLGRPRGPLSTRIQNLSARWQHNSSISCAQVPRLSPHRKTKTYVRSFLRVSVSVGLTSTVSGPLDQRPCELQERYRRHQNSCMVQPLGRFGGEKGPSRTPLPFVQRSVAGLPAENGSCQGLVLFSSRCSFDLCK